MIGNYDQKHNPLGFAQQWNQTGLDKLASKISSVTGILAGQAFSPVMGRMKAEYDWNNANEELSVIMDVIEHEKSKRDRNHKNNQALDALYGAAYENMKKRGIAATGEIKDLKRNTNAEKFLNNLAKYYDVSVKQMKKMYLEVNGVGSIGELQTMISEGKPLKVPMGMGWTKNFQSGYYPQAQKVVQTTRPTSNNSGQNAPFVDGLLDPTGFFQQEKEQREAKERAVRNFKKFKDQQSCQADNLAGHKLYDPNFDPNMQQLKWTDYALQGASIAADIGEVTAGVLTAKFGVGLALIAHGGYNLVKDSMTMYEMIKSGVKNGGQFDNRNRSHTFFGDMAGLFGLNQDAGDIVDGVIGTALTIWAGGVGGASGFMRGGRAGANLMRTMKISGGLATVGGLSGFGGIAYDGYVNGNEGAQSATKMGMAFTVASMGLSLLAGRALRFSPSARAINNRSMTKSEWKAFSRKQRVVQNANPLQTHKYRFFGALKALSGRNKSLQTNAGDIMKRRGVYPVTGPSPVVYQQPTNGLCGVYSIKMAAETIGIKVDIERLIVDSRALELKDRLIGVEAGIPIIKKMLGTTLSEYRDALKLQGIKTKFYRKRNLSQLDLILRREPVIGSIGNNKENTGHAIVLDRKTMLKNEVDEIIDAVQIRDPGPGYIYNESITSFLGKDRWSGEILRFQGNRL